MGRGSVVLVASGGAVLGLLLGLAVPDPVPPPPPRAEPPPTAQPCEHRDQARAVEILPPPNLADPDPALAECQLEAKLLRGQLRVYEGTWREWPESVPATFDRDPLGQILAEAWDELAIIDSLECSEYPCLVTVTLPDEQHSCCTHLVEALPDVLHQQGAHNYRTYAHTLEDGPMRAVITLATDQHWSEELSRRTKWRVGLAGELLKDEDEGL